MNSSSKSKFNTNNCAYSQKILNTLIYDIYNNNTTNFSNLMDRVKSMRTFGDDGNKRLKSVLSALIRHAEISMKEFIPIKSNLVLNRSMSADISSSRTEEILRKVLKVDETSNIKTNIKTNIKNTINYNSMKAKSMNWASADSDADSDVVTDPVIDPVVDPVVDPVTDPVVDPVTDPVVDPVADTNTEVI